MFLSIYEPLNTSTLCRYSNLPIICVSKARLENYVTVLSTTEMKQIDIAIAISLDLMHYYSKIKKNLEDKLTYIQKIKNERNLAQNQIKELLELSNFNDFEELKNFLKNYRQTV